MKNFLAVGLTVVCVMAVRSVALADTFADGTANEFNIDFVPISKTTNPSTGYGIVNKDYRMGTKEITNDQWSKFKSSLGVSLTGSPSDAYDSDTISTGTNVPTNNVTWYEAAQFVNWLNTSSGKPAAYKFTGTQGTSGYTLGVWSASDAGYNTANPYRNSNAFYFLPTEDEWVKAAYWNGMTLQAYSNASLSDLISGSPDPTKWNYGPSAGYDLWNVGSGSRELNGTYDMMGNVWEWMESPYYTGDYLPGSYRGIRGGSCSYYFVDSLISSYRSFGKPNDEHNGGLSFRVASVPEPCSLALLFLGGLALRSRKR